MSTQPEALRLADSLEAYERNYVHLMQAAAELRRLYAALQAERERAAMICHQHRDWQDNPAEAIATAILGGE